MDPGTLTHTHTYRRQRFVYLHPHVLVIILVIQALIFSKNSALFPYRVTGLTPTPRLQWLGLTELEVIT